jgi:hypothetical protein
MGVVQFSGNEVCTVFGFPFKVQEFVIFLVLGHFTFPFRGGFFSLKGV